MTVQWLEQAQIDNAITLDTASLSTMYSQSTFIWLNNQQLSSQAHDALDFISGSSKHGLNPEHYHLSALTQLNPLHDNLSAQQFDILLTDGLLTLIHNIAVGRLQANSADPNWLIPQAKFNAVAFLHDALLKPHLKTQLNSLSPNTAEYYQLLVALSRYQSYVSRGGWLAIPSMPLIHPGDRQKNIPLIRDRLHFENKDLVLSSKKRAHHYDPFLEQAVRDFQRKYGLKVDGIIGSETRRAMNVSAIERLQQIKVTLERHRWMPRELGQRYLLINAANYQLHAINDGNKALKMKVIVGRKSRPTPSFFSQVNHLVFNPYWNVTKKLARLDLLPKQQENLNYFYLHDIRVFSKHNGQKVEHDPYSIDWQSVSRSNFPYTFRQDHVNNYNIFGQVTIELVTGQDTKFNVKYS